VEGYEIKGETSAKVFRVDGAAWMRCRLVRDGKPNGVGDLNKQRMDGW